MTGKKRVQKTSTQKIRFRPLEFIVQNKGRTVFKIFVWVGIATDIQSEI